MPKVLSPADNLKKLALISIVSAQLCSGVALADPFPVDPPRGSPQSMFCRIFPWFVFCSGVNDEIDPVPVDALTIGSTRNSLYRRLANELACDLYRSGDINLPKSNARACLKREQKARHLRYKKALKSLRKLLRS